MKQLTKNQKILEAIKLIESMTRAQWLTGAIMGNNTNTIMAVQLLKSANEKIEVKPRKPKKKLDSLNPQPQDTRTKQLDFEGKENE